MAWTLVDMCKSKSNINLNLFLLILCFSEHLRQGQTNGFSQNFVVFLTKIRLKIFFQIVRILTKSGMNFSRHVQIKVKYKLQTYSCWFYVSVSTFTKGEQMVPVLNKLDVRCSVFGNHDFDFGIDTLMGHVEKTNFPW